MGENSKIAWTHHTFNPWWGCTKVSPGCDGCYAEGLAKRTGHQVWGRDAARRMFGAKHWDDPFDWDAAAQGYGRKRVFCGSMCDIMEDRHDLQSSRDQVYEMIENTPWLDWLLLTKRPQNFAKLLPDAWRAGCPENVWLMTTVECADYLWRINHLTDTHAVVHGLSCEPLLGPLPTLHDHLGDIEWVIVGAESGPNARPMDEGWVREIRDQCVAAGVPFFYKQRLDGRRKVELPELDGKVWSEIPSASATPPG